MLSNRGQQSQSIDPSREVAYHRVVLNRLQLLMDCASDCGVSLHRRN